MKKSLIALAVAGAMTAPMVAQADATVYGNVEIEYVDVDNFGTDNGGDIQVDDARVGVKGSSATDLEGVESFFQIEVEYNEGTDHLSDAKGLTVRQTNAGIKGDFGKVVAGRFSNPAESTEGLDKYSESYSTSNYFAGTDRVTGLAYITPSFGAVDGYVAVIVEGDDGAANTKSVDGFVVGANLNVAGLGLHIAYTEVTGEHESLGTADDAELLQLSAEYSIDAITLEADYQTAELGAFEADRWGLGAAYSMGKATVGATYMDYEEDVVGGEESDEWGVYASYSLGGGASVKAQYSSADVDGVNDSFDAFVLGYNVSF